LLATLLEVKSSTMFHPHVITLDLITSQSCSAFQNWQVK